MKERLAVVVFVCLLLAGGIFLLKGWKGLPGSPALTAVPGRVDGQDTPASSVPVLSPNQPVISQPGSTGEDAPSGQATGIPGVFTTSATPKPGTTRPGLSSTAAPSAAAPALIPTEGLIGNTPTPAGRSAPDTAAGPLKFDKIRVYANTAGSYAGIANLLNSGEKFLNQLVIGWQIVDKDGRVMDQGQVSWPNLAPGETVTISFDGTTPYNDSWEKVVFLLQP